MLIKDASPYGIHFILSAQRVELLNGDEFEIEGMDRPLLEYVDLRICGYVFDQKESVAMIGESGCERLSGYGDVCFLDVESKEKAIRLQAPIVDWASVRSVIQYLSENN